MFRHVKFIWTKGTIARRVSSQDARCIARVPRISRWTSGVSDGSKCSIKAIKARAAVTEVRLASENQDLSCTLIWQGKPTRIGKVCTEWSDLADRKSTGARLLAKTVQLLGKRLRNASRNGRFQKMLKKFVRWGVYTVVSKEAMLRINSMRRSFGRRQDPTRQVCQSSHPAGGFSNVVSDHCSPVCRR